MFLLTDGNSVVVQYPYSFSKLRKDNPIVSFSRPPDKIQEPDKWVIWLERMAEWNMFPVTKVDRPVITDLQVVEQITPVLVGLDWTQRWSVRNKTQAELDQDQADEDTLFDEEQMRFNRRMLNHVRESKDPPQAPLTPRAFATWWRNNV